MRRGADDAGLTLQLLGIPRVSWQGSALEIVRRQARAALYCIAARSGPVPRERLAFLFWPDVPDKTARRNITRLLSYLRNALPDPDCLLSDRNGVQLNPHLAWSDCQVIDEASQDGDLDALKKVPDLYRGPFLAGFMLSDAPEFEKWHARRAAELEHKYLAILHRLIVRHTQAGKQTAAIEYARRYLAIDELAEEVHRYMITLYGLVGDRTAATRQFEQCSLILERGLGVSPLPETRAAYESALRGARAAPPAPAISARWSILPSLELPLVGREAAVQKLANAVKRLDVGGLILISGEPGVGKSRLMQSFATSSGRMVLTGTCRPATHAIPYQPLVEALRQALRQPQLWIHIPPVWRAEAGRLLPELREITPDLPLPLNVEPEQAQARLFEGLTRCLFDLGTDKPLLLCLDDLHWADSATLSWLISVSGRFSERRLLIVATYRSEEAQVLADVKRAFWRANRLIEVPLGGLTQEGIGEALHELSLPLSEERLLGLAGRLHRATGGNTFFVLETMRALLESEPLDRLPETLPLAATVEETLRRRVAKLSDLSQQVLQTAAVLAPDLGLGLLQRTAGRSEMEVADALDELVTRHFLRAEENGHEFNHDLVQAAVYQEITPWRRRILHRRAADAIGKDTDAEQLPRLTTVARHLDAAEAYEEAIGAYRKAAAAAEAIYAHGEAIGQLRRAIELAATSEEVGEEVAVLYKALSQNLAYVARFQEARAAYRQAIAACPPDDGLFLARLHLGIAVTHLAQLYYEKARARLDEALAALESSTAERDDQWWRLWLDIKLRFTYLHFCLYELDKCDALIHEVAPILERVGTTNQKVSLANDRAALALLRDRYRPSVATIDLISQELKLAHESGNIRSIALAKFHLGYSFLFADELAKAEALLLEALAEAEAAAHAAHEARCLAFLSTLYRQRGDRERTAEFARRGLEAGRRVGSRHYQAHSHANLAWLDYREGKEESALSRAERAAAYFAETRVPFAWLAHIILLALCVQEWRPEQAIRSIEVMLDPQQRQLPRKLEEALQEALACWRAGVENKTERAVQLAIATAVEIGYL